MVKPFPLSIFLLIAAVLWSGCGSRDSLVPEYDAPPKLITSHEIKRGSETLKPFRLQFFRDTLWVSYSQKAHIDLFDPHFQKIGSISLKAPAPIAPTDFFVAESTRFVTEHFKSFVGAFDRSGNLGHSFTRMPGDTINLAPVVIIYYGGVAYVADVLQKAVLAVSMVTAEGITEPGELITGIPSDGVESPGFPSALFVTIDGRLLVGDADHGDIKAYSCTGDYMYRFDSVAADSAVMPQAFDIDQIIDPSMQDTNSFDPSNIRIMGRLHLVDAKNARVHMFNPVGRYISSYPDDAVLSKPSDVAIDRTRRTIYVADSEAARIFVFKY